MKRYRKEDKEKYKKDLTELKGLLLDLQEDYDNITAKYGQLDCTIPEELTLKKVIRK